MNTLKTVTPKISLLKSKSMPGNISETFKLKIDNLRVNEIKSECSLSNFIQEPYPIQSLFMIQTRRRSISKI